VEPLLCGHSSRRRVTADAHQRPTRRFRQWLEPPLAHRAGAQRKPGSWLALPSLFGLAPCGVYPASCFTAGAVRSYRTISPLPDSPSRQSPLGSSPGVSIDTPGWRYVFCGTGRLCALKRTSRTLSGTLPCGVRTFLPRQPCSHTATGSDRPVLLPTHSLPRMPGFLLIPFP
jgi:hypothetical protein